MFGFTNAMCVTNPDGLNVTFNGYTLARFKTRYVDPLKGGREDPRSRHSTNKRVMNNDLMDISEPVVQRALIRSYKYAREATAKAAEYFAKRPGGVHRYADMAKIFQRHFKLDAPSGAQRDEVERVLRATAAGLKAPMIICDLLAAKDGDRGSGLVDGAEGQVVFNQQEDALFMQALRNMGEDEGPNDVMRRFLQVADDPRIFIAFEKLKFWNVGQMARVIIHEATHKFGFTGDYAYHSSDHDWSALTGDNAIRNADSYAYAAVSVLASSALSPEKMARLEGPLIPMRELMRIVPSLQG